MAPIDEQHHFHVTFAALNLGDERLPHTQSLGQLHLRKPCFSAQCGHACLQSLVARVINGDWHPRMLYPYLE